MLIISYILAAAALIAILDFVALARARRAAQQQAEHLFAYATDERAVQLSAEERARYPEVLQQYLQTTGVWGGTPVRTVRMRQKGAIRFGPGQAWKPFEAKCFLSGAGTPQIVWYADVTMGLLHSRTMLHCLAGGQASRSIKSWGMQVYPRFLDRGLTRPYLIMESLAAAVWHPDAWTTPGLRWKAMSADTLQVQVSNPGTPLELQLRFDEDHLLKELSAVIGDTAWTYRFSDYQIFHDMRIPMHWTVEIRQGDRAWPHLEGQITDVAVNGEYAWW